MGTYAAVPRGRTGQVIEMVTGFGQDVAAQRRLLRRCLELVGYQPPDGEEFGRLFGELVDLLERQRVNEAFPRIGWEGTDWAARVKEICVKLAGRPL